MKKPIKFKRYEEGGEVADKKRGLEASNKDAPMGFFERLRMGNIDDSTSEAYKRLGAGRGRSEVPAEKVESAPEAPAKIIPRPSIQMRPAERALSDDMYSDYGSKVSTSETIRPSKPMVKKEESVSVNKPPMAKKPAMSAEAVMEADNPRVGKATYVGSPGTADKRGAEDMSAYKPRRSTNELPVGNARRDEEKTSQTTSAPKASSSRVPTPEQAAANRSAAVEKVKGVGSSIADYFSNYETPAERKNRERKEKAAKGSYASGGSVSSASRRADGIATKGKTRGKMC